MIVFTIIECMKIDNELLLDAYRNGYFPMADQKNNNEIFFYSTNNRAIFPIYEIKPPKSFIKFSKQNQFRTSINNNFEFVIKQCSNRTSTWISNDIIDMYCALHNSGYAHSIEVWKNDIIVGGLYGVSIRGAFFGESMFNTISNVSKIAFYFLIEYLKSRKFILLDSQFINDFTKQLGAIEISMQEYMVLLKKAISLETTFK